MAVKPKRVAVLQSNYLPWKGYFDIVHDVDLFVFYDDVQYTKGDWRNRNRIKTPHGTQWLSIPTGHSLGRRIFEIELKSGSWQFQHWQTLLHNHAKCPHFELYREYFEHVYLGTAWQTLSDLNQALIGHIAREFLGINAEFADSRSYAASGHNLDRLLDIIAKTGATSYVSGPAARDYIVPARFAERGIELVWKDYTGYPPYPQRFPPFEHHVSIVDLLFNTGPEAPWFIWGWRSGA